MTTKNPTPAMQRSIDRMIEALQDQSGPLAWRGTDMLFPAVAQNRDACHDQLRATIARTAHAINDVRTDSEPSAVLADQLLKLAGECLVWATAESLPHDASASEILDLGHYDPSP